MTIEEETRTMLGGHVYNWMVESEQEQDFIGREALREVASVASPQARRRRAGGRGGAYSDGSMPTSSPSRKTER